MSSESDPDEFYDAEDVTPIRLAKYVGVNPFISGNILLYTTEKALKGVSDQSASDSDTDWLTCWHWQLSLVSDHMWYGRHDSLSHWSLT